MSNLQKRYKVVIKDAGKSLYLNCQCDGCIVRMEPNKHAVKLLQMAFTTTDELAFSGRCKQCSRWHKVSREDLLSCHEEHHALIHAFFGWYVREYGWLRDGVVSTKHLGEIEEPGSVVMLASLEKRGIKPRRRQREGY